MAFQILSLSGGGFLGLYTAAVLAELEERSGRRLSECFDMFAGTSIGGIVALGLAAGRSAADIRDAFVEHGPRIFPYRPPKSKIAWFGRAVRNLPSPLYRPEALRETIEQIVGKDTCMSDLMRPVVVPAVSLTKGGPKVFKTGHHQRLVLDWRLLVSDVALATSAAPTYFPAHRIGDDLYADGGMFANSPDMIALHEAEQFLGVRRDDIHVLSVGTTSTDFAMSAALDPDLGVLGWMRNQRLTDVMIGSQQALTNDMMKHVLNERYLRIDRQQADEQRSVLALDIATPEAVTNLLSLARGSFADVSGDPRLRTLLEHEAPPFVFINAKI
ncbi:MAG: CBASS cGAMP-activated phospholipase [Sphingobium sp.]